MAIDDKNQIIAFGSNASGQLGLGDNISRFLPEILLHLPTKIGNIIKISCGSHHTMLFDNKNEI
jgi:alpha-tubulin suppressor-like RCC1 family protein